MAIKFSKCIYQHIDARCNKEFGEEGDHVIPRQLGKFNPDYTLTKNYVCDFCNGELGRTIEERYSKISYEAVLARIRDTKKPVVVFGESGCLKLSISVTPHSGKTFHSNITYLINAVRPGCFKGGLIVINDNHSKYAVLDIQGVRKELTKGENKKKKVISRLDSFKKSTGLTFDIVGDADDVVKEGQNLLQQLGFITKLDEEYRGGGDRVACDFEVRGQLDENFARVIAKIALNYFALCCFHTEGFQYLPYESSFQDIINFIRHGNGRPDKYVDLIKSQGSDKNYYFISFRTDRLGRVVTEIKLNQIFSYVVVLGKNPLKLTSSLEKFGNGTAFNIKSGQIIHLSPTPYKIIGTTPKLTIFGR
jgi:hypothetical protein